MDPKSMNFKKEQGNPWFQMFALYLLQCAKNANVGGNPDLNVVGNLAII